MIRSHHRMAYIAVIMLALYQTFFTSLYAMELRGVEHLIATPPQKENKEWSPSWVRGHIYDRL